MLIREGCDEDLPRLLDIYNYYVDHSAADNCCADNCCADNGTTCHL